MTSLVTGGTGFLGGHLVEELVAAGEGVRVLARPGSRVRQLEALGVDIAWGCLEDRAAVRRAVEGMERIYHCAALVADHGSWGLFREINVQGTRHVVESCLDGGVGRLVYVSTTDVYGHPDRGVTEDAGFRRRGYPYGDTKIEGEELVWDAHRRQGLPVVVFRPASIYGPRSWSLVGEIARLLERGQMFHVGGGKKPAGLTYVTNVTDALRLGGVHEAAIGRAYNIQDGLDTSWEEYVNLLADRLGTQRPRLRIPYAVALRAGHLFEIAWRLLPLPGRPLISRLAVEILGTDQGFSSERLQKELGWAPKVSFAEGLDASVAWWASERSKGMAVVGPLP